MKLSATTAALFIWLQAAVCGPALSDTLPIGDGPGGEHHHAQTVDADATGTHRDAGVPHSHDEHTGSGEDHCDLMARTLVSVSPMLEPPPHLVLHASISLRAGGALIDTPSALMSVRSPPKPLDLILQNASFLL